MTQFISPILQFDSRLAPLVAGAHLEKLCSGAIWGEGPVWLEQDNSVLWSDIPNNRMLRWSERDGLTVWRNRVEFTNGHCLDNNGDLLHCSHGFRAIMRTPVQGGIISPNTPDTHVVSHYQGKRLNSPNDVVVKRDGTIWFTDPPYGILSDREGHAAPREQAFNGVYCFSPDTQELRLVSHFLEEPNGLAFSPDENQLYVSDTSAALRQDGTGMHHIVRFDVLAGNVLASPCVFAAVSPGLPDGFRLDSQGHLYTSSADSVQIFHPDGTLLGKIMLPETVGNLVFGGTARNQLYIVASTSLYRINLPMQAM